MSFVVSTRANGSLAHNRLEAIESSMQATTEIWCGADANAGRWYAWLMPCLKDVVFLLPAFLLFTRLAGTKTLFADGDTGWHIRTGEWILQHRAVPTHDLFSFTKPHEAWFAWEWAWDVLFALIHRYWGLGGVAFVTVILLGLIAMLLYKLVLRTCRNEVLGFFAAALAICGTSIHWLARPHLLSWVFFLLFLHIIRSAEEGKTKVLGWLPLLTLFWVNIHGSFFLGVILLLLTAVGEATRAFWVTGDSWRDVYTTCRPYLVCAIACSAVTFVNPYTWHLHQHIFQYLTDAKLLDNIQEYQSISFHAGQAVFFECMLLLGGLAAFWFLPSGRVTPALLFLCFGHLALLSARNIPLFLMIVAPQVAALLQEIVSRCRRARLLGSFFTTISEICEEFKPLERLPRLYLLSGLAVLVLAALLVAGRKGFEPEFNADIFPVQAIPLIEASPARNIFTYDQWGDYLIYRLYPSKRVFMDGRSDFYGDRFVTSIQHILGVQYDWSKQLRRFSVDMVVVKPDCALSTVLKTAPGWRMLFDDGKVLIFETV